MPPPLSLQVDRALRRPKKPLLIAAERFVVVVPLLSLLSPGCCATSPVKLPVSWEEGRSASTTVLAVPPPDEWCKERAMTHRVTASLEEDGEDRVWSRDKEEG